MKIKLKRETKRKLKVSIKKELGNSRGKKAIKEPQLGTAK